MAYSTNTALANSSDETQIVQCVDDENTGLQTITAIEASAADEQDEHYDAAVKMLDRIESARSDADELINTFLRGRYDVPIDPVPAFIADLSEDLTRHSVYKRRMGINMPDDVKKLKSDSISMLEKIQRGTIKISEKPDVQAGQMKTNKTKADKVWDKDTLDRY